VIPITAPATNTASVWRDARQRTTTALPVTTAVPTAPPSQVKIRATHWMLEGTPCATQRATLSSNATI